MAVLHHFASFRGKREILRPLIFALLLPAPAGSAEGAWDLTVETVIEGTGSPTAARLSVTGSDSLFYHPLPDTACLFYSKMGGYFYADGTATISVPAGWTRIRAAKGYEFETVDITVDVQSDTIVQVELERWIDLRAAGWIGGDGHADLTHPPVEHILDEADAKLEVEGEGLHVANFLDNGINFTGSVSPMSDTAVALFPTEEYRSSIFGHMGLLGIDTLIVPDWSGAGWPANGRIVNEARGHANALAVYAHPVTTADFMDLNDWPGTGLARGIWMDAPLGRCDAIDVLSYSNLVDPGGAAFDLWYHLWNCGFTVPGSAGSDVTLAQIQQNPIGGVRVYAKVDDPYAPPQDLYDSWVDGIRLGRTFVTTGPILTSFDVSGAGAGETLSSVNGMPRNVTVSGSFESARSLKFVELVINGEVVDTFDGTFKNQLDISTTIPVCETSWIALRHYAYDFGNFMPVPYAIAHPTPVLVRIGADELTSAASAAAALEKLDLLDTLLFAATYPGSAESLSVLMAVDSARTAWIDRSNAPPLSFRLDSPPGGALIEEVNPTLRWHPSGDPDPLDDITYRFVVARDPDFDLRLEDVSGLTDTFWTITETLTVGEKYWWRVRADDPRGQQRWAEEIHYEFRVVNPTGTADNPPATRFSFSAFPNPSAGDVVMRGYFPAAAGGAVEIYNLAGRQVRSFTLPAGASRTTWDGRDGRGRKLAGGIYFYRVRSDGIDEKRKITLLR